MVVVPIDVALQFPGIHFMSVKIVARCPIGVDVLILCVLIHQLGVIHEDVLQLRGNGVLVKVDNKRKLDAIDVPEDVR